MTEELRFNEDEGKVTKPQEPSFLQTSDGGFELPAAGAPLRSKVVRDNFVYLVLDCSISMQGRKIEWAKEGTIEFAHDAHMKGYQSGLISFESSAVHVCEPQDDPTRLRNFVGNLRVGGSTNMKAAIQLATHSLENLVGRKVMAIVTDGDPDSKEDALAAAKEAKRRGIDIVTLGTEDADYTFLRLLASRDDLAMVTHSEQLTEGIRSMAKILPGGTQQ